MTMRTWSMMVGLALLGGCGAAPERATHDDTAQLDSKLMPIKIPYVTPPVNATLTSDPAVCYAHIPVPVFGPLLCAQELATAGQVMLVWDWRDTPPVSSLYLDEGAPDSFKVYAAFNGAAPVYTGFAQGNAQSTGLGFTDALPNEYRCYTVRAVKGSWESADSNPVCLGSVVTNTATTTLTPQRTANFHEDSESGGYVSHIDYPPPAAGVLVAGNNYVSNTHVVGQNDWNWQQGRGAVRFDMAPLQGKRIWSAQLKAHRAQNNWGYIGQDNAGHSCVDANDCSDFHSNACADVHVGTATADWTAGLAANSVPDYSELGDVTAGGPDSASFDVTALVRNWASDATPNNGFIFANHDTGWVDNQGYACWEYFDSVQLSVTYFK